MSRPIRPRRPSWGLAALAAAALAMAGCGTSPGAAAQRGAAPGSAARSAGWSAPARRAVARGGTWTILVHLAAENNLYRFGLEDLNEMEAGLPADGSIQIYALFDGIHDGDACVYKIKRDPDGKNDRIVSEALYPAEVIPPSHEVDSGSVAVVDAFVGWAARTARADHTWINFWDHGSGIFLAERAPVTKGFGWDNKGSHLMTADLTRLTATFRRVSGKPLAGVGFDACLMGHGEIAYQVAGRARYLVASEELTPGKGWDYVGWLSAIAASDGRPASVASAAVDTFGASYGPGGSQSTGWEQITMSAIDVDAFVNGTVPALDAFVAAARADMAALRPAFKAARARAQEFANADCADLGSFFGHLAPLVSPQTPVGAALGRADAAYRAAILRETHTKKYAGATGAVLYFPKGNESIEGAYTDPARIAFAATAWKDFLRVYR